MGGFTTAAVVPASLAKADVSATATDQNGDKAVCVTAHLQREVSTAGVDCSGATCSSVCACANDKCSSQVDACLADSTCASAQTCVLGCSCGDVSVQQLALRPVGRASPMLLSRACPPAARQLFEELHI